MWPGSRTAPPRAGPRTATGRCPGALERLDRDAELPRARRAAARTGARAAARRRRPTTRRAPSAAAGRMKRDVVPDWRASIARPRRPRRPPRSPRTSTSPRPRRRATLAPSAATASSIARVSSREQRAAQHAAPVARAPRTASARLVMLFEPGGRSAARRRRRAAARSRTTSATVIRARDRDAERRDQLDRPRAPAPRRAPRARPRPGCRRATGDSAMSTMLMPARPERERDLGDDARAVRDRGPQLVHRAAGEARAEQRVAVARAPRRSSARSRRGRRARARRAPSASRACASSISATSASRLER